MLKHLVVALSLFVLFAPTVTGQAKDSPISDGNQPAGDKAGPAFGKWRFTAKETSGVVWTGTLILSKVDSERFSRDKYHSVCNIEATSTKGGLGVEHPATYDPSQRTFSFGKEGNWGGSTYTATLSADGKKLEKGTWRQSDRDFESKKLVVVSSGDWSAELVETASGM